MKKCTKEETRIILLAVLIVAGSLLISLLSGIQASAATSQNIEACKQEMLQMMRDYDLSEHDFTKYKITVDEMNAAFKELVENEGMVEYNAYDLVCMRWLTKAENKYVAKVVLYPTQSEGFQKRYDDLKRHIAIVQNVTTGMTDLEKVVFINDYIMERTTYGYGTCDHKASGPLSAGISICSGYTNAGVLLLRKVGIEALYLPTAVGSGGNHAWTYVKLDGKWYHMDSTWDDSNTDKYGTFTHYYLLRNDSEFASYIPRKHAAWNMKAIPEESLSTTYSNWFVHDIIGKIHYYDGLWYYVDSKTGNIVRSKIEPDQSQYKIMVDTADESQATLKIEKVENNVIYYTSNGVAKQKTIVNIQRPVEFNPANVTGSLVFNKDSSWKPGKISEKTGKPESSVNSVYMTDYVKISANTKYKVYVKYNQFKIVVTEIGAAGNVIASNEYATGEVLKTSADTKYLLITLFNPVAKEVSYNTYNTLFSFGLEIKLNKL